MSDRPDRDWSRRLAVLVLGACFLVWLPTYWQGAAACLVVFQVWPLWTFVLDRGNPRRVAWLLTLWLCISSASVLHDRATENGWARAFFTSPDPTVSKISSWARENTAKDAVFLVNPGAQVWEPFPGLSRRSIVTNWNEGGAINWDPDSVTEWNRRISLFGFDIRKGRQYHHSILSKRFSELTDQDVEVIRSRVPFRYWIAHEDQPSGYAKVFGRGNWKVLDLEGDEALP